MYRNYILLLVTYSKKVKYMNEDEFLTASDLMRLKGFSTLSGANKYLARVRKHCNIKPYGKVTWRDFNNYNKK